MHDNSGVALPNLMTNLKTIYAKTEPFRFLKPIRKRQDFKIMTIRNGMPRIIAEYSNPRVAFEASNADLRALGILLLPT